MKHSKFNSFHYINNAVSLSIRRDIFEKFILASAKCYNNPIFIKYLEAVYVCFICLSFVIVHLIVFLQGCNFETRFYKRNSLLAIYNYSNVFNEFIQSKYCISDQQIKKSSSTFCSILGTICQKVLYFYFEIIVIDKISTCEMSIHIIIHNCLALVNHIIQNMLCILIAVVAISQILYQCYRRCLLVISCI